VSNELGKQTQAKCKVPTIYYVPETPRPRSSQKRTVNTAESFRTLDYRERCTLQ